METAERIAAEFHRTYEDLASGFGYETREASAKPWEEIPDNNRRLMIAVVQDLLNRRVISDPHPAIAAHEHIWGKLEGTAPHRISRCTFPGCEEIGYETNEVTV